MGLSEREQKLLAELERGLLQEDAGFRSKVERVGNPASRMIGGALLAVVGLGVLVASVLLQFAVVGVVGFLLMLAGLVIATSNLQLPDINLSSQGPAAPPPGRNFFEDRWDRRQGGN